MALLGDKGVAAVGIGGAGAAGVGAADDYGDGMQCPDHPYRPNAGAAGSGGVCAFCLQEKLGKLVSSSSSKYSFSPLPSSLFYDKDGQDGSSSSASPTPRSAASSRYSSASAANAAVDAGKGKKGSSHSYSLFGGRRRRHAGKEYGGEESKPGSGAAAGGGKHSSGKMMMIPFFHSSSRSNGHGSKTAQKVTNPPNVPPVYANRNGIAPSTAAAAASSNGGVNGLSVFTRSRSVTTRPIVPEGVPPPAIVQTSTSSSTTPRLRGGGDLVAADSPRKRRFWSFLHLSSSNQPSRPSTSCSNNPLTAARDGADGEPAPCPPLPPKCQQSQPPPPPAISSSGKPPSIHPDPIPAAPSIGSTKPPLAAPATASCNDDGDQAAGDVSPSGSQTSATSASPFGRKVERSRSVGCGSRSFSGDFLERISTGLGDCALRRVESHREPAGVGAGKLGNKIVLHRLSISTATAVDDDDDDDDGDCRRRRSARCGGIFGGMIPSSFYNSSSAAASSYWPPPQDELCKGGAAGGSNSNSNSNRGTPRAKGGWGWAFASPMRAFRTSSAASNGNSFNQSHKHPAFHGPEADTARRSMSVAGGVGFGAGVRAPSYPYMNGG